MNTYFYIRVSSTDQNENRQIDAVSDLKIPPENIYIDKQSGKNAARPGLQKLLSVVRQGDTVIVESVSRFARNTRDLLLYKRNSKKSYDFLKSLENFPKI